MNILLTGHCSNLFIIPWMKAIKEVAADLDISVWGLNNPAGTITEEERQFFSNIYEKGEGYKTIDRSKLDIVSSYVKANGLGTVAKKIWKLPALKEEMMQAYWEDKEKLWVNDILKNKDIVWVHYLNTHNIKLVQFLDDKLKLILSFWGSDLMQESSEETWNSLKAALKRANVITVQNHGMRFICCTKYGWDLFSKIKIAPFVPNNNIIEAIHEISKEEAKAKLSELFDIPMNSVWLSCGYRPIPIVQQAEIIPMLGKIPEELKKELVIVLTMSYSLEQKAYIEAILNAVKAAKINYVIIDRYLDDEELAALRKAMDIFIHLPLTDAMSTTLVEHLYAGNFVVTSRTLPYGLFRKHQLEYKEIDELEELSLIIEHALRNPCFSNEQNRQNVAKMLSEDYSISNWLKVIYE